MSIGPKTVVAGRRHCTGPNHQGCRFLPVSYFYVAEWVDEAKTIPKRLQAHCQTCQKIDGRVRQGIQRRGKPYGQRKPSKLGLKAKPEGGYVLETEEDREKYREYQRERYRKLTKKQKDDRREYGRIYAEVRRRRNGVTPRSFKNRNTVPPGDSYLPFEPFQEWVLEQLKIYTVSELAEILGYSEKQIRRWRDGEDSGKEIQYVSVSTVDRTFMALDRPELMAILYPDS